MSAPGFCQESPGRFTIRGWRNHAPSNRESMEEIEVSATAVTSKPKGHVFLSRRDNLRLVKKKEQERKDHEGNVIETIRGEHLAFVGGKLVVPAAGEMRGEKGEILDAKDVLMFLMGDEVNGRLPHSHYGDRHDGFWLHEEPAPVPTAEERDALGELAIELDVDGLERFVAAEEAGWGREELLTDARAQLARARAKVEERAAQLAAAVAEGEKNAAKVSAPPAPKGKGDAAAS